MRTFLLRSYTKSTYNLEGLDCFRTAILWVSFQRFYTNGLCFGFETTSTGRTNVLIEGNT